MFTLWISFIIIFFIIFICSKINEFIERQNKSKLIENEINIYLKTIEKGCENLTAMHTNDQKVLNFVNNMMDTINEFEKKDDK